MSLKSTIKKIAPDFVRDMYQQSQLPKKKKIYNDLKDLVQNNANIKKLFPDNYAEHHYATKIMRNNVNHPDLYITQVRYFRMYEYFKKNFPDMFEDQTQMIEVGDSSGILLSAMHKKGISVDINAENVKQAQEKGLDARHGSIYELPFEDKAFDYAMSFQCLEHLEAPLLALKELGRVARKNVFVSIPYREETLIYSREYWDNVIHKSEEEGGWEVKDVDENCDYHIFEFNSRDFITLATYTNLKCAENYPINYFEPIGTSTKNKGSYFNFFNFEVTDKGKS